MTQEHVTVYGLYKWLDELIQIGYSDWIIQCIAEDNHNTYNFCPIPAYYTRRIDARQTIVLPIERSYDFKLETNYNFEQIPSIIKENKIR